VPSERRPPVRLDAANFETSRVGDRRSSSWSGVWTRPERRLAAGLHHTSASQCSLLQNVHAASDRLSKAGHRPALRFMGSSLFPFDLLTGHEPHAAGNHWPSKAEPISIAASLRPPRLCASLDPRNRGARRAAEGAEGKMPRNHGWIQSVNQPVWVPGLRLCSGFSRGHSLKRELQAALAVLKPPLSHG